MASYLPLKTWILLFSENAVMSQVNAAHMNCCCSRCCPFMCAITLDVLPRSYDVLMPQCRHTVTDHQSFSIIITDWKGKCSVSSDLNGSLVLALLVCSDIMHSSAGMSFHNGAVFLSGPLVTWAHEVNVG